MSEAQDKAATTKASAAALRELELETYSAIERIRTAQAELARINQRRILSDRPAACW